MITPNGVSRQTIINPLKTNDNEHFFESGTTHQPVRTGRTEEMVSRSVHHQDGGRKRSGYADS